MACLRVLAVSFGVVLCGGCIEDSRTHEPPDLPPPLRPSELQSDSWDVCRMLGPASQSEGIYGTDLGYATPLPNSDKLAVLFGDTWSEAGDACQYPVTPADDLQATLPRARPDELRAGEPSGSAKEQACASLEYTVDDPDDPQSWRRMLLFASVEDRDAGMALETGALRTPVAAWTTHREDE
jgi:hypothetical protein